MPSVKIPRKSTATDMTPFVDVAFLILAFFMLATKFKPPEPVEITTPKSVSSDKLKEQDALRVEIDKTGRVFFSVTVQKSADNGIKLDLIKSINQKRNLGLTDAEMQNFVKTPIIGVPFSKVKALLDQPGMQQEGVPVLDSANNELTTWVNAAITVFQGHKLNYLIKGDNNAKYPVFKGVIDALRNNDQNKYQLITDPESVPSGTDLYKLQNARRG